MLGVIVCGEKDIFYGIVIFFREFGIEVEVSFMNEKVVGNISYDISVIIILGICIGYDKRLVDLCGKMFYLLVFWWVIL